MQQMTWTLIYKKKDEQEKNELFIHFAAARL